MLAFQVPPLAPAQVPVATPLLLLQGRLKSSLAGQHLTSCSRASASLAWDRPANSSPDQGLRMRALCLKSSRRSGPLLMTRQHADHRLRGQASHAWMLLAALPPPICSSSQSRAMLAHKSRAQGCVSVPGPQTAHPGSLQQNSMQTQPMPWPQSDQVRSLAVTMELKAGLSQQLLICIAMSRRLNSIKACPAMTRSLRQDNQHRPGAIALHTTAPAVRSCMLGETQHPCRCLKLPRAMTGSSGHSSPRMATCRPPQLHRPAQVKLQVRPTGSWDSSIMQRRLETPQTPCSPRVVRCQCQHLRQQSEA